VGTNVLTLIATDPFTKKEVGVQSFSVPKPEVTLTTTLGSLVVILEPEKAPLSSQNFLANVAAGAYNGSVIHEIARGDWALGGMYGAPTPGKLYPELVSSVGAVPFESPIITGLSNYTGTVAVYRNIKSEPDSGTTGFMINLANYGTDPQGARATTINRDGKSTTDPDAYAVFGRLSDESLSVLIRAESLNQIKIEERTIDNVKFDSPISTVTNAMVTISAAAQTR
jgi:cyclophilin family peptidyl-prolyl cis-trans isomerase